MEEFYNLDLNEMFSKTESFEEATKIMLNRNVLTKTKNMLSEVLETDTSGSIGTIDINILVRCFLSSYLISWYSYDVFGSSDITSSTICELELILLSKTITESIPTVEELVVWNEKFLKWKENDKQSQIEILCQMYHDYSRKIEDSDEKFPIEYIEGLKGMQQKIYHQLDKLVDDTKKCLEENPYIEIQYDDTVSRLVDTQIRKLWWEDVTKKIESGDFSDIEHVIDVICIYMCDFNPTNSSEYKELIDGEFIVQKLSNGVMKTMELGELFCFVLTELKKIDAKDSDVISDMYITQMKGQGEIKDIVDCMKYILNRLEFIEKCKEVIKNIKNVRN